MTAPSFKQLQDDLMEEFVKAEDCTQTNAQVGQAVLEFILKRERLLRGVVHGGYKQGVQALALCRSLQHRCKSRC